MRKGFWREFRQLTEAGIEMVGGTYPPDEMDDERERRRALVHEMEVVIRRSEAAHFFLLKLEGDVDHDCVRAMVVCARGEREARRLAAYQAGDEGAEVWFSERCTCRPLRPGDAPGVVLQDVVEG